MPKALRTYATEIVSKKPKRNLSRSLKTGHIKSDAIAKKMATFQNILQDNTLEQCFLLGGNECQCCGLDSICHLFRASLPLCTGNQAAALVNKHWYTNVDCV